MSAWQLAWRGHVHHPARSALAVAGVTIIGALLFDMLLLSHGLLISFERLLDSSGFDVRVVEGAGLTALRLPIPGADALAVEAARLPEVDTVALVKVASAVASTPARQRRNVVFVGSSGQGSRRTWNIVRGDGLPASAGPQNPPPLVVASKLARALNLVPGSLVSVRVTLPDARSALPSITFRVLGIGDFAFEAADDSTIATTIDAFNRAQAGSAGDEADALLVKSRDEVGAAAAVHALSRLRPDLHVYSNDAVLAQFTRNGFAYFRQISFVLTSITLGFTFLLLTTLLTVSINQRLGEVAALRALGFRRRRIAALLVAESALLVACGWVLALFVGGALAIELDRILKAMPGVPDRLHFFVLEPRAVVLHALLLSLIGLLAAAYPIWIAVNLPIAATLRREIMS